MIISKTPLRISLAGGGTDLPSYSNIKGGFVISAAINKHIYISVNKNWQPYYQLKYFKSENKKKLKNINHPAIREVLRLLYSKSYCEISCISDVPAGTGLGSSGSFLVGLINSVAKFQNLNYSKKKLAELSSHIEMNILKQPSGIQDQYISSYGGIKILKTNKKGNTNVQDLNLDNNFLKYMEENILLFFSGYSRKSSKILEEQTIKTNHNDKAMIANLDFVKSIADESIKALKRKSLEDYGLLMKEHWDYKLKRSKNISNFSINRIINIGLKNGAIGAKLVGAGGGGFLMFVCKDKKRLRKKIANKYLRELEFKFDFEGSKIIGR